MAGPAALNDERGLTPTNLLPVQAPSALSPPQAVVAETVKLAALLGGLLGGGLLLGGPLALRAFTSDPAAIAAAAPLLPLVAASQPINALAFVWDGELPIHEII
jgi:hypothetical protein